MKVKHNFGVIGLMFSRKCDIPVAFEGTSWIHTAFMKYPIDILFLGRGGVILDKCENLEPWGSYKSKARGIDRVVEAMSGKFKKYKVGDNVVLEYI